MARSEIELGNWTVKVNGAKEASIAHASNSEPLVFNPADFPELLRALASAYGGVKAPGS